MFADCASEMEFQEVLTLALSSSLPEYSSPNPIFTKKQNFHTEKSHHFSLTVTAEKAITYLVSARSGEMGGVLRVWEEKAQFSNWKGEAELSCGRHTRAFLPCQSPLPASLPVREAPQPPSVSLNTDYKVHSVL